MNLVEIGRVIDCQVKEIAVRASESEGEKRKELDKEKKEFGYLR